MKIAVMQPYLWPYAGYFRLFAATDLFVIYDDVQYLRQGWIHRNKLTKRDGTKDWINLPLKKMPQSSKINETEWADDYHISWRKQTKKFPILEGVELPTWSPLMFIVNTLLNACTELKIPLNVKMASTIPTPDDLRGKDRILVISAKHWGQLSM